MTVERSQGNAAGHVRKVPEDATLTDDEGVLAVLVVRGPEARLQRVLRAVAGGGGGAGPPPPPPRPRGPPPRGGGGPPPPPSLLPSRL